MPEMLANTAVGNPPQLDPLETTVDSQLPSSYQTYRVRRCGPEYQATLDMYCHLDNLDFTTRAEQLLECRLFAWFCRHSETGEVLVVSNSCRLRWCPICTAARFVHLREVVRDYALSVRSPKLLTLTMRHTREALAVQISALYKHFRNFRLQKHIKRKIRGGVWFFQIKRSGRTGEWHPHLHCIIDADFIDKVKLSQDWLRTTGDSFIVDIRKIQEPKKVADYVSRYVARPCKLEQFEMVDRATIFRACHGRRLCGKWGNAMSVMFKPPLRDDRFKWIKLARWSVIVEDYHTIPLYRKVLKCWMKNEPLDSESMNMFLETFNDLGKQSDEQLSRIKDRQLLFEEFR